MKSFYRFVVFVAQVFLGVGFFGMTLSSLPVFANGEESNNIRTALETWTYANWQTPVSDSLLNPGNRIANLPKTQETVEARLDMRFSAETTDVVLRSRMFGQCNQDEIGTQSFSEAYLSQGFARMKLSQESTLTAGRELLTWGPANFRSPSNPFYFDAGRTQPLLDVSGIDLARMHYTDGSFGVTGGYVVDAGHLTGAPDYSHIAFLKCDYRGNDYLVSAISSQQKNQAPFFGGFAQLTLDEAILLYGELGSGQRPSNLQVSATSFGAPFELQQPSPRELTSLLGGSYTFINGQVVSLEYLHDGHGYSLEEEHRYFERVREAGLPLNTSLISSPAISRSLGTLNLAISQAPSLLGRDYVSIIWQSNPQEGTLYWRLMSAGNVHDYSSQTSLYVEKNISPRISLFALVTVNAGHADSEYGALLSSMVTMGAKFFVF
ncbi:MAG: hypothetical protein KJ900_17710 [Proteobacteria bacterium]|nr:hypothetical protein [Desulfocapsa sp.]MBU4030531.1 hypothetical protein [Pseudomonadota bacterium]MBU4044701.1 hypothetical protein [Pseudomonadota bacterium]